MLSDDGPILNWALGISIRQNPRTHHVVPRSWVTQNRPGIGGVFELDDSPQFFLNIGSGRIEEVQLSGRVVILSRVLRHSQVSKYSVQRQGRRTLDEGGETRRGISGDADAMHPSIDFHVNLRSGSQPFRSDGSLARGLLIADSEGNACGNGCGDILGGCPRELEDGQGNTRFTQSKSLGDSRYCKPLGQLVVLDIVGQGRTHLPVDARNQAMSIGIRLDWEQYRALHQIADNPKVVRERTKVYSCERIHLNSLTGQPILLRSATTPEAVRGYFT